MSPNAQAADEPLEVGQLRVGPAAEEALRRCWWRRGPRSLYTSFDDLRQLVAEVGWGLGRAGGRV